VIFSEKFGTDFKYINAAKHIIYRSTEVTELTRRSIIFKKKGTTVNLMEALKIIKRVIESG